MRKTLVGVSVVVALVAVGCGGDSISENIAENIIENQLEGDGEVDINFDDGDGSFEVNVTTAEGESISIGGGEVPDSLEVDVPSGGDVMQSIESNDVVMVMLSWPQSEFDSIVSFYDNWVGNQPTDFDKQTSTIETSDGTVRTVNWWGGEPGISISISDCYSLDSDGLDAVCVTVTDSNEG